MIRFRALANRNAKEPIPDELRRRWAACSIFPGLGRRWTYAQGNVFMSIEGDCDVSRFVHASPSLILMCHADLLGTGAGHDFCRANQNPAAYIAGLYQQQGDEFARHLRGWFGVVLYDLELNTLKAWTDHFGVRRIVYRSTTSALGVSSDLRLLNAFFDQPPEIDPQAVLEYMQYCCIPAPRTFYRNTFRLEPGHWLASRPAAMPRPYWEMKYAEQAGRSLKSWAAQTYDEIHSAVSRSARTPDEAPEPGCFLSGGTDSSSVSGLVGRITGRPPRTYSIGFDDPRYNEIEYARIAARHFHADHHEYFVKPLDVLNLLQTVPSAYDEPFGNSSIIPSYYCARLAVENGTTHLLAGDGGDELFGGNQRYADDRMFERYSRIPAWMRRGIIEPCLARTPFRDRLPLVSKIDKYVRRARIPVPDRWHSYDFISSTPRAEIFSPEFLTLLDGADSLEASRRHFSHAPTNDDLNRWLYLDVRITLNDNDLTKVTSMCDLAGVTPRYPLLDPALAEFSGTVPADLKVRGTRLRYLFKIAMAGLLPGEIIKKKKHGFGLPYSIWVGDYKPLRDFTLDLLRSQASRNRNYFRPGLIDWVWSNYESVHRNFYGGILWQLLVLELWHIEQQKVATAAR